MRQRTGIGVVVKADTCTPQLLANSGVICIAVGCLASVLTK